MKKRERLIKEHLKSMEESRNNLPEKYHPIEGITEIHYGFMGRKTITAEEIKDYKYNLNCRLYHERKTDN